MTGRIIPLLFCLVFAGCTSTLTKSQFERKYQETVNFRNTLIGTVYYQGTQNGYDYFKFEPVGFGSQQTRVLEGEADLEDRFPYTRDRREWTVVDPYSNLRKQFFNSLNSTNIIFAPDLK